ncbi:histidine kinase N-terminal 7TM domain-containing diguanylate cyclase [Robertmurraya sp. FSL R5-0851]|uniref:histidine kinase N-terminal 7TM domain-containing diguanylate cyclase n=1 Tax=Robertmurraya sp. FSL R5-0851 TaxID=2921584 RepID=UPI0030FD041A
MNSELILYVLIIVLAAVLSVFLSFFTYLKLRTNPGAKPFLVVTILSSLFSFFYIFELTSTTLKEIKLWLSLEYLVMPFIPAFILLMCCEYIGRKIPIWVYYVLFTVPCITIFMHATNEMHHLYYTSVTLRTHTPFPIVKFEYGVFFYFHALYLFLCLVISIITLLVHLKKGLFIFRMQILTMIAGLIFPIVANYFYLNDLSPYGIDLGPVSMSLSFLFHTLALISYKMFNVTPVYRDTVFERMKEGVLVLNKDDVILDYNHAMMVIMPALTSSIIGMPLKSVITGNEQLDEIIGQGEDCDYEILKDGERIHFQVQFSHIEVQKNTSRGAKIISFVNITEKIELQEKLKEFASIDGLTQVFNRSFFIKKSEEQLRSMVVGEQVAFIMFDIDHFKKVNDTYGHQAGDLVLSHVVNISKNSLSGTDFIGRYGGEEFVIMLPNTSLDDAYALSNNLRLRVLKSSILVNNVQIQVTLSLGVSSKQIYGDENIEEMLGDLVNKSDQALYMAKRNGRNNTQKYVREQLSKYIELGAEI